MEFTLACVLKYQNGHVFVQSQIKTKKRDRETRKFSWNESQKFENRFFWWKYQLSTIRIYNSKLDDNHNDCKLWNNKSFHFNWNYCQVMSLEIQSKRFSTQSVWMNESDFIDFSPLHLLDSYPSMLCNWIEAINTQLIQVEQSMYCLQIRGHIGANMYP